MLFLTQNLHINRFRYAYVFTSWRAQVCWSLMVCCTHPCAHFHLKLLDPCSMSEAQLFQKKEPFCKDLCPLICKRHVFGWANHYKSQIWPTCFTKWRRGQWVHKTVFCRIGKIRAGACTCLPEGLKTSLLTTWLGAKGTTAHRRSEWNKLCLKMNWLKD